MKFARKAVDMGGTPLKLGVHKAKFTNVEATAAQSGKGMIKFTLTADGASKTQNIVDTGDQEFSKGGNILEANMSRMLAAINDTGVEIPDIEWTFKTLYQFLHKVQPTAYVRIRTQRNNEQYTEAIFISKEQYDADATSGQDDSKNPFAASGNEEIDIDDDDLPF
ncbi:MAG: hypothetical protein WBP82_04420 [Leuconostoc mesenteroides]